MQDTNYHINDQATSSTDLEDAITLSIEALGKSANIFNIIGKDAKTKPTEHGILAITGNHLAKEFDVLSRHFQSDLLAKQSILKNSKSTKEDKVNFIENKIDEINIAMDSVNKMETMFNAIISITDENSQAYGLAEIGRHITQDMANLIDCMREEIEIKCDLKKLPKAA